MPIGERYAREKCDDHYDVIVIGSGIGGLSAASLLTKAGKKVLVLERHTTAGGFTHTYKRKGYEWDVGVHYIGDVMREKSLVRKMFDYISDGELKWASMGDVYDRLIVDGDQFDFRTGYKQLRDDLIQKFPAEEKGIRRYFDMLKEVKDATPLAIAKKLVPTLLKPALLPLHLTTPSDHAHRTTAEVLDELFTDENLKGILATQWGDCGLPPEQSSFFIHAMIAGHYANGAGYPVGGSARIAETIEPVIKAGGGRVMVRAEVAEILVKHGRAYGVRMANGDELKAKTIISTVGVPNTYGRLLDERHRTRYGIPRRMENVQIQGGHLCLYIGLKKSAAELGLGKTNLWVFPSLDHNRNVAAFMEDQQKPFPLVYISFPSAKDPDWDNRFPGKSTIEVVTLAPYAWFEEWKDKPWLRRGEKYEQLKAELSARLLRELYKQVPQVEGEIDYFELSTPLSTQHFCNYSQGEIYGLDHVPQRFEQSWLRPKTPIENLYLGGQDVFVAGVAGALTGGLMAGAAVLGPGVLKLLPKRLATIPAVIRMFA
ncbi:phytoene desaturase family protein [Acanthopleuribacter pedis]|uniref:NAD(P)/FAD-dependent oxidoreductase n=1 Tax=Acanthopleuribacter pedis TaxID=442870 RepID=A0A8J7Q4J4_9BACT|nr:NAD(P)/FAD-dependent oxidoreductase [Acanthopleuribacter pedis]MBO1317641.1 NAD(P)/FAD-dependent oxidoreductase [Acanthopleuribacter pedis]